MQRTIAVTAVTTLLIALAATTLTGAAPAAPRWPPASLDYWTEAAPLLATLAEQSTAGLGAAGKPSAASILDDAVTAVTQVAATVAKLEPPPALLPLHTRLTYAASTCQRSLEYAGTVTFDGANAVIGVPVFMQLSLECLRSINEAQVEAARYAATVGGFPKP